MPREEGTVHRGTAGQSQYVSKELGHEGARKRRLYSYESMLSQEPIHICPGLQKSVQVSSLTAP